MAVVFRVDSSYVIGSGHLSRCLVLADKLSKTSQDIIFITQDHPGNLNSLITEAGYKNINYPQIPTVDQIINDIHKQCGKNKKIQLLIIDHYDLDVSWENQIAKYCQQILVIDDLANRKHNCHYLLDHNLHFNLEKRYQSLVNSNCTFLLGPQYALLKKEFRKAQKKIKRNLKQPTNILVFFGSTDPTNETQKFLRAVTQYERKRQSILTFNLVVGKTNPFLAEIKDKVKNLKNINLMVQINNMAQMMALSDAYIGSGGYTALERCSLGLPGIIVTTADNQVGPTRALAERGAQLYIGDTKEIKSNDYFQAIDKILKNEYPLASMSKRCREIVDGLGVERVLQKINF